MQPDLMIESGSNPFLEGGGETGQLIRSIDWSETPLGPPELWPQSLKTCVRIILTSRQPMFVWWGKELINIYNDAYIDIVRGKHPEAMGQPATIVWKEIWDEVGPRAETVMGNNEGTYDEDLLLIMERNGYPEETYYTFSYSPVPGDDGGTSGIICANTDETERIIGERQLRTLKDLGKSIIDCKTNAEVFRKTANVLESNPYDFPFAFIYELDESGSVINMVNMTGTRELPSRIPSKINIIEEKDNYPSFFNAVTTGKPQIVRGLRNRFPNLPTGAWEEQPDQALVLPIIQTGHKRPYGFISVGLNPYRLIDEKYLSFFQLIADQVITALATVHSYEEERKRAEALAEIDRAKTTFFSNISHEFRTPLTLMLSPLEEIKRQEEHLPEELRENIDISYRNTLRLQKLVNSLLDFSRIEAGRMQAHYERVDIAGLTRDLASSFRSAVEKSGMELLVSCEPIQDIYVDVDMWEKIILNLLSNALKYSTKGRISVRLAQKDERMILSVTDTGVGIPKEEVNKIFERFHRIQNVQGRSQEGTGIGLALVQELVKLHHGTITVDSEVGKGSTFTISLPIGNEHLPPEKIRTTNGDTGISTRVDAYVEEALKWLPSHNGTNGEVSLVMDSEFPGTKITNKESRPTILLADDNADMRAYVKRLLTANYHVEAVENGALALQKLEELVPDLVLSDVMMPEIDGFELVKRLKSAKHTSHIPVILLSARAGEEATIEGLQTGADDYLVKPFSARELVTRIDSNIKIAKARNNAARQLHHLFMQAPVAICILKGPEFIIELANDTVLKIWGKPGSIIGMPVLKAIPEIKDTYYPELLKEVYEKGITHYANENSADFIRNGITEKVYFNFVYQPMYEVDGRISGILVAANEVTELVEARKKIEDAEERLRMAAEGTGLGTWDLNLLTSEIIYSRRLNELFGYPLSHRLLHEEMRSHIHPDDLHAIVEKAFDAAMANGNYYYEARVVWKDGSQKWIRTRGKVIYNEEQKPVRMLGTMIDITAEKEAEIRLRESEEKYRQLAQELETRVDQRTRDLSESNSNLERSNKELEQFAFVTSHDLQEPLRKIQTFGNMLHDHYEGAIGEKGKNYLEKMLNASQRMSKLINDLLNFSRLRQSEGYVATDLNEILANIKNDFELVINQKKAVIKHDRLPVIDANPLQMNQLFYNLLSNALKFTNENTVPVIEIHCLETNSERVKEFPYLNKDKKYFEIVFTDNGIGFPQEYAKKIFEIFQRLNARSEYEGTGIGLALVNKIVDNHKGIVYARSEEGKGSAFHILLPAKQE